MMDVVICLFIGRYHGFNKNNLTSDSGGKTKVVQRLKDKYGFKRCAILLHVQSWVNTNLSSVFLYLHFFQNFKKPKLLFDLDKISEGMFPSLYTSGCEMSFKFHVNPRLSYLNN